MPDFEAAVSRGVKGLKIGIPKEYRVDGMPPEIEALWQQGVEWLRAAGAEIVDISLPHTKYALPAYYIVAPAEASSNLARYDGVRYGLRVPGKDIVDMYEKTRAAGFGREVKRRIMIGTYVLSAGYYDAYYVRAQKVRTLIKRDFEEVYAAGRRRDPDPGDAVRRLRHRREGHRRDPVEMYLNDIFTVTVNMAGLPGIAVPAGLDAKGLPLGLQLIGRAFDEETLFAAGQVIEDAAGRIKLPEPWWAEGSASHRSRRPSLGLASCRLRSGSDRRSPSVSAGRPTSSARSSSRRSRRWACRCWSPGRSAAGPALDRARAIRRARPCSRCASSRPCSGPLRFRGRARW